MWQLSNLLQHTQSTRTLINKHWVPARPINHKHRSFIKKFKEACAVFFGTADCFKWPENQ
jgi:hypothetical protein